MPIIINGQIIDPNSIQPEQEEKIIIKEVVVEKEVSKPPVQKIKKAPVAASKSDILVVDGKAKSIGKKSKYLLDMLTLDD